MFVIRKDHLQAIIQRQHDGTIDWMYADCWEGDGWEEKGVWGIERHINIHLLDTDGHFG